MHPVLFRLGPFTVYSFGVALALAFLAGTWCAQATMLRAQRLGAPAVLTPSQTADFVFWLLLSSILGARFLYIVANRDYYLSSPWEVLAVWHGGLIFYGGLAGGWLAAVWYLRRQQLPMSQILDLFTPSLALGQSIGRIGCFLNGCCYGKPAGAPWGVRFPWSDVPRYPTQLFESAATLLFAIVFSGWIFSRRIWERPAHGRVALTYACVYALWRFGIECLRGDNPPLALGLNFPQWVSLGLIAVSGVWLSKSRTSYGVHRT